MAGYVVRRTETAIHAALADTRVVIVNGARQSGKSTVVHAITRRRSDVLERRLDRPSDLQAAKHDPERFVVHDGLLVIDEIQRAPEIVLPIKARVDQDDRPGQFLLTGSARLLGMRNLPDALVGRSETVELWPFSQGEIDGRGKSRGDRFVDAVFESKPALRSSKETGRDEYFERATRGGFPEAIRRTGNRRSKFFESYIQDLIDRDVSQLSEIHRRSDLHRLVRLLASRCATPLKIENLASQAGIPATTLERYVTLFEEVFLIKRIGPWSNSRTARAVRMRKLLFVDSGLAAFLSGSTLKKLEREPALAGQVLENFVLSEVARQLTWCEQPTTLLHYRTRDGEEVDGVLEANDGRIVGIKVKSSSTVHAEDFRHLAHLERLAGKAFHRGIVLYTGNQILPFGPRMIAAPVDVVWLSG